MNLKTALRFLILYFVVSCEQQIELPVNNFMPDQVVNAKLNPDSVLTVALTWSQTVNDTFEFIPIDNGDVLIYSDSVEYQLEHRGEGVYQSDEPPNEGKEYHLKLITVDGEELSATTSVPLRPIVTAEPHRFIADSSMLNYSDQSYYQVTLSDRPETKDTYWIAVEVENDRWPVYTASKDLLTDLTIADDFNRSETSHYGELIYSHRHYIRLRDNLFNGDTINFKIGFNDIMQEIDRIIVFTADEHLNNYIKSVFEQNSQRNTGDLPVFYTPVNVYSNIENGKGIFCAYSSTVLEFDHNENWND